MIKIIAGHVYELAQLDEEKYPARMAKQVLSFVRRKTDAEPDRRENPGTYNQEVLRVLIDRVKFLDAEKPWVENDDIIHHLRTALVLHECRALEMKMLKLDPSECLDDTIRIRAKAMLACKNHMGLILGCDNQNQVEDIPCGADGHWIIPFEEKPGNLLDAAVYP